MRWFTHKSVAVAGALALGTSAPALVGVALGSILPDSLDMALAGRNKALWRRIHRGTTHWMGWYLLLIIGGQLFAPFLSDIHLPKAWTHASGSGVAFLAESLKSQHLADVLSGLGLGALSHVLLDALNPSGVPLSPLGGKPRLSLNLVSTGTWGERVFLVVALALIGVQFASLQEVLQTLLR